MNNSLAAMLPELVREWSDKIFRLIGDFYCLLLLDMFI